MRKAAQARIFGYLRTSPPNPIVLDRALAAPSAIGPSRRKLFSFRSVTRLAFVFAGRGGSGCESSRCLQTAPLYRKLIAHLKLHSCLVPSCCRLFRHPLRLKACSKRCSAFSVRVHLPQNMLTRPRLRQAIPTCDAGLRRHNAPLRRLDVRFHSLDARRSNPRQLNTRL